MTNDRISIVCIHGIGKAKEDEMVKAVRASVKRENPEYELDVQEVYWADLNNPSEHDGALTAWGYDQAVQAISLSAGKTNRAIGGLASKMLVWLLVAGNSLLAFAPPIGIALFVAILAVQIFWPTLQPYEAPKWIPLLPIPIATCILATSPVLVACVAKRRTRFKALLSSMRCVGLSFLLHTLAPACVLLLIPVRFLGFYTVFAIESVLVVWHWLSQSWIPIALMIAFLVLLVLGRVAAGPARLLLDIFSYTGNESFRTKIQTRVDNTIRSCQSDHVVVLAHSLGSVVALDSLRNSSVWTDRHQVSLVTMGSPIARYFQRFFPGEFFPANVFHAYIVVSHRLARFRWLNLYRPFDYVGASIGLPDTELTQEYSTGQLTKLHTGYWTDLSVAKLATDWLNGTPGSAYGDIENTKQEYSDLSKRAVTMWGWGVVLTYALVMLVSTVLVPISAVSRHVIAQNEVEEIRADGFRTDCDIQCMRTVHYTSEVDIEETKITYSYVDADGLNHEVESAGTGILNYYFSEDDLVQDLVGNMGTAEEVRAIYISVEDPEKFFVVGYPKSVWSVLYHTVAGYACIYVFLMFVLVVSAFVGRWSMYVLGLHAEANPIDRCAELVLEQFK